MGSSSTPTAKREAEVISSYLLKQPATPACLSRYLDIVKQQKLDDLLDASDAKLLHFAVKHPWSLGFIDSYLAFFKPDSQVRYRIHVMVAVLESTTEYTDRFLPKAHGFLYFFYIGFVGVRAVAKIPLGLFVSLIAKVS